MTHFMAYVILLSAAAGAVAIVGELVLRARTVSTRWLWVGALGTVLLIAGIATFAPPDVREAGRRRRSSRRRGAPIRGRDAPIGVGDGQRHSSPGDRIRATSPCA